MYIIVLKPENIETSILFLLLQFIKLPGGVSVGTYNHSMESFGNKGHEIIMTVPKLTNIA